MPMITRRAVLLAPAAAAFTAAASAQTPNKKRIRLAVSSYSYWHFKGERTPIETVITEAARIGFDGVEILHRQMDNDSAAYCNKLRRLAFENGLALVMLSIHQDFVSPDAVER